jgi:hypothetical protein
MKSLKSNIYYIVSALIIVAFALIALTARAQSSSSFPAKTDFFQLDVLGQLYFVNGSELKKYSKDGVLLKTYSNLYYGDISSLDVSDPMNILLYYKDNNKILMLDNQLSVKNSPIDLSDLGYEQAMLACLSYNNSFWIFDPISQSLIRFNNLLKITESSGNLLNITGYQIQPVQLIERDNQLILRDSENGIFVFDRFGNYLKRIPFLDIDDLYIRSGVWQMLKNDTNLMFDPITLKIDTIPMPYNNVNEFRLNNKSIYFRYNENEFMKVDL